MHIDVRSIDPDNQNERAEKLDEDKLREEEEDRAFAHWMKNIHMSKGASRIAGSSSGKTNYLI